MATPVIMMKFIRLSSELAILFKISYLIGLLQALQIKHTSGFK